MDSRENWMLQALQRKESEGLMRFLTVHGVSLLEKSGELQAEADRSQILNFSSNDYLGLSSHPEVLQAAQLGISEYGTGAGASRLVSGHLPCHQELEDHLAEFLGVEAALVCGAGYLANLSAIGSFAAREDVIFADRLVHASLIDGIQLSGAKLQRFKHNDMKDLERLLVLESAKRKPSQKFLVITESVFSMDGDIAPLADVLALCERYECLSLIDEAHAVGVFGDKGAGVLREPDCELRSSFRTGTMSKAFGSYGGFIACSQLAKKYLVNSARPFIYNTALPPSAVMASLKVLELLQQSSLGVELQSRAKYFREALISRGLDLLNSDSQIIPLVVGDAQKAVSFANRLKEEGIFATAMRPPTVPPGTSRIRFSVTLSHSIEQLERAADQIASCAKEVAL